MVLDASAIVALFRSEPTAASVESAIQQVSSPLFMSSVTLTEVALAGLKIGTPATKTAAEIEALSVEIVSVDESMAIASAEARHRFPISFGDSFVYALAKARNLPILTLDAEFAKTDAALIPLI